MIEKPFGLVISTVNGEPVQGLSLHKGAPSGRLQGSGYGKGAGELL
jgi:hypothetical protein